MNDYLDRIIEEQARVYGLSPEQLARFMSGAAEIQELIEENERANKVD